jgi:hypothetical protein
MISLYYLQRKMKRSIQKFRHRGLWILITDKAPKHKVCNGEGKCRHTNMSSTTPKLSNKLNKNKFLIGGPSQLTALMTWLATIPPTMAATGANSTSWDAHASSRSNLGLRHAALASIVSDLKRLAAISCSHNA